MDKQDRRRNTTPASTVAREHAIHTEPELALESHPRLEIPAGIDSDEIRSHRLAEMNGYMSKIFTEWQSTPRTAKGRYEHQLAVDHMGLVAINNPPRKDTFTLNPGQRPEGFNTEDARVLVLDEPFFRRQGFIGKPIGEVLQYIRNNYGEGFFFPDIQDLYWMLLTGVVKEMNDTNKVYIFMGSNFSSAVGESNNVPALRYTDKGVRFFSYLGYRGNTWSKEDSIVLYKW